MIRKPASTESTNLMLSIGVGQDTRSDWQWFWVPDDHENPDEGWSLIFGCFPRGDTFFATETDHS